jgi:hypothetical protein
VRVLLPRPSALFVIPDLIRDPLTLHIPGGWEPGLSRANPSDVTDLFRVTDCFLFEASAYCCFHWGRQVLMRLLLPRRAAIVGSWTGGASGRCR